MTTSIWNGDNPGAGLPGNGTSWDDPRNWTRDGVADAGFIDGDRVIFGGGSSQFVIDLAGNRTVSLIEFDADYTLQNNILQVDSGQIAVSSGVLATIDSRLNSGVLIQKLGQGTLRVNGFADALEVQEGTLSGTGRPDSVVVRNGARFAPGKPTGNMIITTNLLFDPLGIMQIQIGGTGQFGRVTTIGSAQVNGQLEVSLIDVGNGVFAPQLGDTFVILTALGELTGTFDTSQLTMPGIGLGWTVNYDYNLDMIELEVVSTADYNGNGILDCQDIDLLQAAILSGSMSLEFDVNGDGAVNSLDFRDWVVGAKGTLLGDANFDFVVDASDFNIWNANKFTSGGGFCQGDFNGDGVVDTSDFNVWNSTKFQSASPQVVPESQPHLLLLLAGGLWWRKQR